MGLPQPRPSPLLSAERAHARIVTFAFGPPSSAPQLADAPPYSSVPSPACPPCHCSVRRPAGPSMTQGHGRCGTIPHTWRPGGGGSPFFPIRLGHLLTLTVGSTASMSAPLSGLLPSADATCPGPPPSPSRAPRKPVGTSKSIRQSEHTIYRRNGSSLRADNARSQGMLRKQLRYDRIKENKVLRNKFNQGGKRLVHCKPQDAAADLLAESRRGRHGDRRGGLKRNAC